MASRTLTNIGHGAVIAVFLTGLLLPLATGVEAATDERAELRELAPEPAAPRDWSSVAAFPDAFEDYYADRFGLRSNLLVAHRRAMRWMRTSPTEKVVFGDDGWLFYTNNGILEDYRGETQISDSDLEQWRNALVGRHRWLAEQGGLYVFVAAPNKVTIYPDKLQARYRNTTPQPTRLDQLVEHVGTTSAFGIVDLRGPLREARQREQVYLATDSHWNPKGSFLAYRHVVEHLRSHGIDLEPLRLEELQSVQVTHAGDLARLLGEVAPPDEPREILRGDGALHSRVVETPELVRQMSELGGAYKPPIVRECASGKGVLLMFRDSFADNQIPWFAEHFRYSIFVSSYLTHFEHLEAWVRAFKPTVVIEQRVERHLAWPPGPHPTDH